jgi:diketogulonate reductase-like aldo/keto reductase
MAFEVYENGICRIEQMEYPVVGFGTYPLKNEICSMAVTQAIKLGYRIIDTATKYKNFEPIGEALKSLDRHHFYIISKAWHNAHHSEGLNDDIKTTLKQLNTPYLDAYLLHWPNSQIPIEETLLAMEELRIKGLIRHIGLSNVTVNHLKRALEVKIPISWVQVEMHPFYYDHELLDFCQKHSITVQAWRPLNLGRISEDKLLSKIGEKYEKTPCQVSIKWILQHGCIPLPGSKNENHMQQNLDMMNFSLSKEEIQEIDQRALTGTRFRLTEEHELGFVDEFDFSYKECWPKQ